MTYLEVHYTKDAFNLYLHVVFKLRITKLHLLQCDNAVVKIMHNKLKELYSSSRMQESLDHIS